MRVNTISSTEDAELLVCKAGRGDYYDGYIDDVSYLDIMEPVTFKDQHVGGLPDLLAPLEDSTAYRVDQQVDAYLDSDDGELDDVTLVEVKTRAFIETQLSRGHFGLWEHPQITFAIEGVSRSLMAQLTRHRHLTFDIQSMRYANFSDADVVVPVSIRSEEHMSRETGLVELSDSMQEYLQDVYEDSVSRSFDAYDELVQHGVPKEDARMVLPIGTKVNITVSGNARAFLHLLSIRGKADAQWEIRDLAAELEEQLYQWMPYTVNWFRNNRPHSLSA